MSEQEWNLDFESDDTEQEYQDFFKRHPGQRKNQTKFEVDIKADPFFHPKHKRIRKMKGDYAGLYRWKESNTRVIYHPHRPDKTVYVIETGTATGISYKKRGKK